MATVRRRLLGIISEGLQHVGQAAYVRGLLKGKGWPEAGIEMHNLPADLSLPTATATSVNTSPGGTHDE